MLEDQATTKQTATSQMPDARERAIRCAQVAADNRGRNILILDMRELVRWVDYLVIVTGTSRRQIVTIADEIEASLEELGEEKIGVEGREQGAWVVLDYADVVVHIFDDQSRDYYQLENLWSDAAIVAGWERPAEPAESSATASDSQRADSTN